MLKIQLSNIEELVFRDKQLQKLFPEFEQLFNQWTIGQRSPAMRFLSQKSALAVLSAMTDQDCKKRLSQYFNKDVIVEPIEYHSAKNMVGETTMTADDIQTLGMFPNWCIWRDQTQLYISSWR